MNPKIKRFLKILPLQQFFKCILLQNIVLILSLFYRYEYPMCCGIRKFYKIVGKFHIKGKGRFFNKKSNLQIFVCICEFV